MRRSGWSLLCLALVACGSSAPEADTPVTVEEGDVVDFTFGTVNGELIGSGHLRGRVTVLLFMTTFDLVSQAQAKRLQDLSHEHKPRLNALGVMLEPPRNVDLARTFAASLGLDYPIAMADGETLAGRGPWGSIRGVPTWVVLDRNGRVNSGHFGALSPSELEASVKAAE